MGKAMKASKGMKAMKVMGAKRVSMVAKGKRAKGLVLAGKKEKTVGGLKASNLFRNKWGKVVSKKASAQGRRNYKNIESWTKAVKKAREALNLKGFVAIGGKTGQGKALYAKAKAFLAGTA